MEDDEGRRRRPSQERSKATVAYILEATTLLLREGGMASLTTRGIAERAGVGVGTVYQYFDGRDALLLALLERRREAQLTALLESFADAHTWTIRELTERLVRSLFTLLTEDIAVQRALNLEMLRLRGVDGIIGSELDFAAVLLPLLEARRDELRPGLDVPAACWLVVHTVSSARLSWIMTDRLQDELDEERLVCSLIQAVSSHICAEQPVEALAVTPT